MAATYLPRCRLRLRMRHRLVEVCLREERVGSDMFKARIDLKLSYLAKDIRAGMWTLLDQDLVTMLMLVDDVGGFAYKDHVDKPREYLI